MSESSREFMTAHWKNNQWAGDCKTVEEYCEQLAKRFRQLSGIQIHPLTVENVHHVLDMHKQL